MKASLRSRFPLSALAATMLLVSGPARAQLLDNLHDFPERQKVGDPEVSAAEGIEGPKGVASADFNRDGRADVAISNLDGTVTLLLGLGDGEFGDPVHLQTDAATLRGIIAADLNGDSAPDIATAAPLDGLVFIFWNDQGGAFGQPTAVEAWSGARNLIDGDFDGDGVRDLAVAGPGRGLRHYRGTGRGEFEVMGDLPRLAPADTALSGYSEFSDFPKPVYTLKTIRSRDRLRDDLVVMHAQSGRAWILGTQVDPGVGEAIDPSQQLLPQSGNQLNPPIIITEFLASNRSTLADEDGDYPDWVELFNRSPGRINLAGWQLRDSANVWTFPPVTLDPGQFLIVFASGKNRIAPGRELHTGFRLATGDESLALFTPAGAVAHQYSDYPSQLRDVSYGVNFDGKAGYYDQPSPGFQNNAGVQSLTEIRFVDIAQLSFVPANPLPGQGVRVEVRLEDGIETGFQTQYVWFSRHEGVHQRHHLMREVDDGHYAVDLAAGVFDPAARYQVLARVTDPGPDDYITIQVASSDREQDELIEARPGALRALASAPSQSARSFDLGPLTSPANDGRPDLITANRDTGLLEIRRGNDRASRFDHPVYQSIYVSGGPRALKIVDLDGDGWNDLIVVLRNFDLAITYKNTNGRLELGTQMATGVSPREIAVADFNADGSPDAAVINRESEDLSILKTLPNEASFVSLDQIYPTSGDVSGLSIVDYNGDGRDDVVQLHRASWEYSVRLSEPDGSLGPPNFYSLLGGVPGAQIIEDVNNDGVRDAVTANLGSGSVSVRLADGVGGFGEESIYDLPPENAGSLFALIPADFDLDGNVDLAAGYYDCRVAFFRGSGDGSFSFTRTTAFVYESRVMRVADLDQDGDPDLVGAGAGGDLVVFENRYNPQSGTSLLTSGERTLVGSKNYAGAARFDLALINDDEDPDLIIGSNNGVSIYFGSPGLGFGPPRRLPGINERFPVSAVVAADFDDDGTIDTAASCSIASCITISIQDELGEWAAAVNLDVPAGRHLATGDLDGDGKPDLVGAGDVLWTALSSRRTQESPPVADEGERRRLTKPVINEILTINNDLPLEQDGGKSVDWIELYLSEALSLAGWKLEVVTGGGDGQPAKTQQFSFPGGASAVSGDHSLVYFSTERRSAYHTGFKLPGSGATVRLFDSGGNQVDEVTYPAQQPNISYSRYEDAHPAFTFDAIPSPGLPNSDNGAVEPLVEFDGFARDTLAGGKAIRVFARGSDDVGIETLLMTYARLDVRDSEPTSLILYDDGLHEDGGVTDGLFSGVIEEVLPAGAAIQFYFEVTDLSGKIVTVPDTRMFVQPGEPVEVWSLSLGPPPPLEISQVVADNASGPVDEAGGTPDFIRVRNTSGQPVSLDGVMLARSFVAAPEKSFRFPSGSDLAPGEEVIVFADANPAQGPMHTPFSIDRGGDRIVLMSEAPDGGRIFIDSVDTSRLEVDQAFTRLADTAYWTINAPDLSQPWQGRGFEPDGSEVLLYAFPTVPGDTYLPEFSEASDPETWNPLGSLVGDGSVQAVALPYSEDVTFRLQIVPMPPALPRVLTRLGAVSKKSVEVLIGADRFGGEIPQILVYYGRSDGGNDPQNWEAVLDPGWQDGLTPSVLNGLEPGTTYFLNVQAANNAGAAWAGSESISFATLPPSFPEVITWTSQGANTTAAAVSGRVESPGSPPVITIFYGSNDGGTDPAAWDHSVVAQTVSDDLAYEFDALLSGLDSGRTYRFRVRSENAAGTAWSAGVGTVQTQSTLEALQEYLVISELMYHPLAPNDGEELDGFSEDDFEFIELYNRGPIPLDLSLVSVSSGIRFDFANADLTEIQPGQFLLLVRNVHAFEARYGSGHPVAGSWLDPFNDTRLSNAGETLTLSYGPAPITSLLYRDTWVGESDGSGFSLVRIDPGNTEDPANLEEWTASFNMGGSPGEPDRFTFDLWRAKFFTPQALAHSEVSGPHADPDRDGRSNLSEYAFLGHPLVPDGGPGFEASIVTVEGQEFPALAFPYQRRATDLSYRLESSADLEHWAGEWGLRLSDDRAFHNPGLIVSEVRNRDHGLYIVRSRHPIMASRKRFLRVHVTIAP